MEFLNMLNVNYESTQSATLTYIILTCVTVITNNCT